jgi:3-oxoacyl-[acyl-carrier protein] reductase
MQRFTNKRVLITGGASGIGRATARRFSQEGAVLMITDRDVEKLDRTSQEIREEFGNTVHSFAMDVSRKVDVDRMASFAVDKMDGIDVLINNAGVCQLVPFLDLSEEEWDNLLDINLKGHFLVAQAVAREMVKARQGAIVNMCSTNGLVGEPYCAHYNASKGGILLLTKCMALELAPHNIRVNCVAPGFVFTPLLEGLLELDETGSREPDYYVNNFIPMARSAQPEEIAGVFAFLASDDASFMTGEVVVVDGGQLAL